MYKVFRLILFFLSGAVILCIYEGAQWFISGTSFVPDNMVIGFRFLVAIIVGGFAGLIMGIVVLRLMADLDQISESKEQLEHLLTVSSVEKETVTEHTRGGGLEVFSEVYEREWRRAIRCERPLTLVLCAVDFKDTPPDGINYGDALEVLLNERVKRPADAVVRYGDNSVLLLLPDTSVEGASKFVERLRHEIANQPVPPMNVPLNSIAVPSVGLASGIPIQGYHSEDMIRAVEKALEQSRSEGFIVIDRPFRP